MVIIQSKAARNYSIDIFRYVCAILVVAIHTKPFSDVNDNLGYIFVQILPRIAVPFFFATSGYFYFKKLEQQSTSPLFPYLKRLLTIYFIWSVIYFCINFVQAGRYNLKDFIVSSAFNFVISGSYYHFWFFPALIFAVCFSTLLYKLRCRKLLLPLSAVLYIIGCLGCSYYKIGIQIPFLNSLYLSPHFEVIRRVLLMGFPFFVIGYVVYKIQQRFKDINKTKMLYLGMGALIVWLVEICFVHTLKWDDNIVITFGLYLLVVAVLLILLQYPLLKFSTLSNRCRVLANFTYYAHPLCIVCLSFLGNILNINISATPLFIITVLLTCAIGLIIDKLDCRFLNQIVR